jgi:hypothetical protein
MIKKLFLTIFFLIAMVSLGYAADDPLCVAVEKVANFWGLIQIGFPVILAVVIIASGGLMVRREHMLGTGIAVIFVGIIVGILLIALLGKISPDTIRGVCQ